MPDSLAAVANPALDSIQKTVHTGISGIVSMLMIFLAIQIVALFGGSIIARTYFRDSKEKRKMVLDVARLLGVIAGGLFIYFWVTKRAGA